MHPLIAKLEAFAGLSNENREAISRILAGNVRHFAARRDIVCEGDRPKAIYAMLEGWACRYKTLPDGRRQLVAFFVPGDLCDLNIFILREMDHSVGAITSVKAAELHRETFEQLLEAHPRVTRALWWNDLVAVSIQREWTVNLGQRTARERIAHLLCELYYRLKIVGLTNSDGCDFPVTQHDLGDATGLTAVHVNRTIKELRTDGLISLQGKRLTILDLPGLRNAGLFTDNYLHLDRFGSDPDDYE